MKRENMPFDVQTIHAAMADEVWTVEKIINCYSDEIDRICAKMKKQSDGSIKKIVARICGNHSFQNR